MAPEAPPYYQRIFEKPGLQWTRAERNDVWIWVNSPPQLRLLLWKASLNLGTGSTAQDAEDAWSKFNLQRYHRVVDLYNPAQGTFWNYLTFSFARACYNEGRRSRRNREYVTPIEEMHRYDDQAEGLELPSEYAGDDPERMVHYQELLKAIEEALAQMKNPNHARVWRLRYFEGLEIGEIAAIMNCPKNTVSVWLLRANEKMEEYLLMKGWEKVIWPAK